MLFFQMKIYYATANHSKNFCLTFLTDKLLKSFDEGLLSKMILIDLQKAFDKIDHEILLQKLKQLDSQRELYSGLDLIFLSKYFLLILKISSQILETFLVWYPKSGCYVPFCFWSMWTICQRYFYVQMIHASCTNTKK